MSQKQKVRNNKNGFCLSHPFISERIIWALGKLWQLRSMVEAGAGEPGLEAGASLEQVVQAVIDNLQRVRWKETELRREE